MTSPTAIFHVHIFFIVSFEGMWRFSKGFLKIPRQGAVLRKAVLWRRKQRSQKMQQWLGDKRVTSPYRSLDDKLWKSKNEEPSVNWNQVRIFSLLLSLIRAVVLCVMWLKREAQPGLQRPLAAGLHLAWDERATSPSPRRHRGRGRSRGTV